MSENCLGVERLSQKVMWRYFCKIFFERDIRARGPSIFVTCKNRIFVLFRHLDSESLEEIKILLREADTSGSTRHSFGLKTVSEASVIRKRRRGSEQKRLDWLKGT